MSTVLRWFPDRCYDFGGLTWQACAWVNVNGKDESSTVSLESPQFDTEADCWTFIREVLIPASHVEHPIDDEDDA